MADALDGTVPGPDPPPRRRGGRDPRLARPGRGGDRAGRRSATRTPWPRLRTPATTRRRSPDDLYVLYTGGHDRHAQGRDVAPGGHLLRRHGRRRLGGGTDHDGGRTRRPALDRRGRPDPHARGGAAHARQRPVGHVERLHDGGDRRALHGAPLRRRPDPADDRRRARGVHGPGGGRHGPAAVRGAGRRTPRDLRHVDPRGHRLGRGDAVGDGQGRPGRPVARGDDHGPVRLERGRRPGRGRGRAPADRSS